MAAPASSTNILESYVPFIAAVVLFVAGLGLGIWACWQFTYQELVAYATFVGGTAGPLWSAAGLLLLVAGYSAQKYQLELQRQEIHESSRELQRTRMEARFCELVRLHSAQVEQLDTSTHRQNGELIPIRGRRCLYMYYQSLLVEYREAFRQWRGMIGRDPSRFREILDKAERVYPATLYGYYISVHSLLRAVERASASDEAFGADLIDFLVAQFSDVELALILVKFYSDARFENTLALARKHNFFRNHDEESIWRNIESSATSPAA